MNLDVVKGIPPTLIDVLRIHALYQPTRPAFTFLANGESESITITCGELDHQAKAIGSLLQRTVSVGESFIALSARP